MSINLELETLTVISWPFMADVRGAVASWLISELDSGSSGLGMSPGRGHRVVFMGKTRDSHSASLHPGV